MRGLWLKLEARIRASRPQTGAVGGSRRGRARNDGRDAIWLRAAESQRPGTVACADGQRPSSVTRYSDVIAEALDESVTAGRAEGVFQIADLPRQIARRRRAASPDSRPIAAASIIISGVVFAGSVIL